ERKAEAERQKQAVAERERKAEAERQKQVAAEREKRAEAERQRRAAADRRERARRERASRVGDDLVAPGLRLRGALLAGPNASEVEDRSHALTTLNMSADSSFGSEGEWQDST